MNLHLTEIATQIASGAHAALLVDQAGWHLSGCVSAGSECRSALHRFEKIDCGRVKLWRRLHSYRVTYH
jgi:hypothetical protein